MADFTFIPSKLTGEEGLQEDLGNLAFSPLDFVQYAYPWGEGGLKNFDGPDKWARDVLEEMGEIIRDHNFRGDAVDPLRIAITSGHGIGKTAFAGWVADFIRSTRPDSVGTVTAQTLTQLKARTWPEIKKWGQLSITSHWFNFKAESLSHRLKPKWKCHIQASSKDNSEAFAGQHAVTSTSYYIFDEASAIHSKIWEVAEGGLTDGEPMLFALGNPTINSGEFHNITCGRKRKYWFVKRVDSREVKITNKRQIQEWIDEYGENSDFVRVRVRGLHPRTDNLQCIGEGLVEDAIRRELKPDMFYHAPIILGVDPSGDGEDEHIIVKRQGLQLWILAQTKHLPRETVGMVNLICQLEDEHKPDATFIDQHGIGGAVINSLRALGRSPVAVDSNSSDISDPRAYVNARIWMAVQLREWLKSGGSVPDNDRLRTDFTAPHQELVESGRNAGKYILESKKDMRSRGVASPGLFDAAMYTFYQPVKRKTHSLRDIHFDTEHMHGVLRNSPEFVHTDYDVLAYR